MFSVVRRTRRSVSRFQPKNAIVPTIVHRRSRDPPRLHGHVLQGEGVRTFENHVSDSK